MTSFSMFSSLCEAQSYHFPLSHCSPRLISSLFLYPLYRSQKLTPPLRRLAKRTLWAALVALVTSATNVAVLMVLHGQEFGWVCLGSCTADVTINALALFFVTGSYDDPQPQKPIDTVTAPVIRRRSAMPILQTSSAHQPGNFSSPFISMPGTLVNNEMEFSDISSFCPFPGHWTSWPVYDVGFRNGCQVRNGEFIGYRNEQL